MQKEAKEIALQYLKDKSDIISQNDTAFAMFFIAVNSPNEPSFQYFWKNPYDFSKYPKQVLELKGQRVWANYALHLAETDSFETAIEPYFLQMKVAGVEQSEKYRDMGYILYYGHQKDWGKYLSAVTDYAKKYPDAELNMQFCNWAGLLAEQCADKNIRKKMLKMVNLREKLWEKENQERQSKKLPQGTIWASSLVDFQKTFTTLKETLSTK